MTIIMILFDYSTIAYVNLNLAIDLKLINDFRQSFPDEILNRKFNNCSDFIATQLFYKTES